MRAAQLVGPKQFSFTDVPTPTVGQGNVLIEIERWSICGSDIRNLYGAVLPEQSYPAPIGNPGHEIAGRIVESRSDRWDVGQRVIALPHGRDDALVEHYEVLPNRMIAIPDEGDPGDWLMCQPSGTVLYACQQLGTLLGKSVLILGQGPIGLTFTAIFARSGARKVIGSDLLDYRLDFARRFGATHTLNPMDVPIHDAVSEILDGELPDLVVEAAGYPDTLQLGLDLVSEFGTLVMFGLQQRASDENPVPRLRIERFRRSNATLLATASGHMADPTGHIARMVELKQRGWWDPSTMITHRTTFENIQDAYDLYDSRKDGIVKVVIHP